MFSPFSLLLGAFVVTAASTIQASTGFGFALVALPFLMIVFGPKTAVGISMIVSFCSLFALLQKVKAHIQWGIIRILLLGMIIGLPAGVAAFSKIEVDTLKLFINIAIVILSILMVCRIKFNIDSDNKKWQLMTGIASGFLTNTLGMPGPPVILFLSNMSLSKEKQRATMVAYFVLTYMFSLITMFKLGNFQPTIFLTAVALVPFSFIGLFIGCRIFDRISPGKFRKVVSVFLMITAFYSIATTLLA
jgi:uncharacterized membrane protein YfcA